MNKVILMGRLTRDSEVRYNGDKAVARFSLLINKGVYMKDIEEMIADAKAEEEVAREQAIESSENKFREDLKAHLIDAFKDNIKLNKENSVTLSLDEYLILKFKERDLENIISAIIPNLTLGYDGESLRLNNKSDVVDVIKVIYPDIYEAILEDLQQKEGE